MTTVLGSTKFDGKGDRDKCLKIIEDNTKDLDLYIYDFPQITVREEIIRQNSYFKELRKKYRGNYKMLEKIRETTLEIRKKTFLPTDMYLKTKKKKEEDDILNF